MSKKEAKKKRPEMLRTFLMNKSVIVNTCGFDCDEILKHKEEFDEMVAEFQQDPVELTPYETQVINEALCRILYASVKRGLMKKEQIPRNILNNFPFELKW